MEEDHRITLRHLQVICKNRFNNMMVNLSELSITNSPLWHVRDSFTTPASSFFPLNRRWGLVLKVPGLKSWLRPATAPFRSPEEASHLIKRDPLITWEILRDSELCVRTKYSTDTPTISMVKKLHGLRNYLKPGAETSKCVFLIILQTYAESTVIYKHVYY